MEIHKEWLGSRGYVVARFYSCSTCTGVKYFLDWNNCIENTEVFFLGDGTVRFAIDGVPKRYKDWIIRNASKISHC